jgi:hypothetical protein
MTVVLEKPYNKAKIDTWFANLHSKRNFDADKFAGQIVWNEDPLAFQKRLRNEWE